MENFEHDQQALLTGMLIGLLMRHGIPHQVEVNDAGYYTPVILITLDEGGEGLAPLQVPVMVLP
jgi:hypothetical protein